MGALKFICWSAVCIGVGVTVSSVDFHGRTIAEWSRAFAAGAKSSKGNRDDVKAISAKSGFKGPTEQHSEQDRSAVDSIIAKHQQR